MFSASTKWVDGERFVGAAGSAHGVVVDAGHEKIGSSPMELVLIGLCGCTASDVVAILNKKREPFTSLEVNAEAERAPEPPMVFTKIRLVYRVAGVKNRKSMEDAVRLSKEKYCSVSQMLQKTAEIMTKIEYVG